TLAGVIAKEKPNDREFHVPQRLKELYMKKDFGQYALPDGELPVCFITTNDITGGNSGSPVLNATGELVGIAFDGNWESLSGDLIYEPQLQRCIAVDIRYVLFIIDKYANSSYLVQEIQHSNLGK
ncbi:MAG: S46 family peptidase, partial [Bacteroidales bacterium]|nr:S46 family peptidase [Bacteroidales bacterium]